MSGSPQDSGTPGDEHRWVSDPGALAELGRELERAPAHAFDSESNSGFAYRERLCLLQFNVANQLWLVDLLALGADAAVMDTIRGPLESDEIVTWLHGGEFDVGSLKRDFDLRLGGVWDTQQAASFLGWEKTGYGAVVERVCSVTLDKAWARYDWSRRPLDKAAVHYALDDVRYLPRVARSLAEEVGQADLEGELMVANRAVMDATWSGPSQVNGFWRIKGVHKLDPSQLPRLMALYEWREGVAKREDVPPGRLVHPEVLLAIARRSSPNRRQLRSLLRGRHAAYTDELVEVLRRAQSSPPRVPARPQGGGRPSPGESRRLKALKQWRRAEAERRDVPQPVVLPPTAMQHLARHGADDLESVPQLGEKRIRLYGDRLAELSR